MLDITKDPVRQYKALMKELKAYKEGYLLEKYFISYLDRELLSLIKRIALRRQKRIKKIKFLITVNNEFQTNKFTWSRPKKEGLKMLEILEKYSSSYVKLSKNPGKNKTNK